MGDGASRGADARGIRKPVGAAGACARSGRLDQRHEIAGGCWQCRLQSRASQGRYRARGTCWSPGRFVHHVSQAVSAERVSEGRRVEMSAKDAARTTEEIENRSVPHSVVREFGGGYSRRDFLKAAGSGIVLTSV